MKTVLAADKELPLEAKRRALACLQENHEPAAAQSAALLTQAEKARQLGVSRFTVRKLTKQGRLHPIELLPGLNRYRADELV